MGKLKNLKKLEKLKPYVLQLNLQPKRLLAIYYNFRTCETSKVKKLKELRQMLYGSVYNPKGYWL